MPLPAAPFWPPAVRTATQIDPPAHRHPGRRYSPGFWIGIFIFVTISLAAIFRHSYLASPDLLHRIKRRLGVRPGTSALVSHYPIQVETETEGPYIARPEWACLRTQSKDTLPLYRPATRFSTDVLLALVSLEPPAGSTRPPSYRSRLPLTLEQTVGETTGDVEEVREQRENELDVRNGKGTQKNCQGKSG